MLTTRTEILADGVTLHLGDCLDILGSVNAVDAVVTDPPYGTKTNQRDEWMIGEFSNVLPLALPLIRQSLNADGAFYCFTSWTMMPDWLLRFQQYFKLQNIIIWDKQKHSGCWTANSWQFTWEGIYFGLKGSRKIRDYLPDIIRSSEHGTRLPMQKPVDVVSCLIRASTDIGQLILDPFAGTGTTGVAAVNLGRRFTGIEIEPKYFDIACRRIADALARPSLFIETPARAARRARGTCRVSTQHHG